MKILKPVTASFTLSQCWRLWNEINEVCFDGELRPPLHIIIERDLSHLIDHNHPLDEGDGGGIAGFCDLDPHTHQEVLLFRSDLQPRELMEVMAHEMVHQHLAQTVGYRRMCQIGHNRVFDDYAERISRYHGLKLLGEKY